MNAHQRIAVRLRPLYVAAFFQGFVLWYPIEKVFMHQIGFNDAGIGGMIAFYSAVMLLAETPSGILADRWSRKGVLVLASMALTLSAFMGGISTNPAMFLASAGLWGIFFALYSGTYESIVYDTILEENAKSDRYEHYYGRISSIDSIALVVGSICGGLAAQHLGLRSTFFITMPMSLLAIVALTKFREPRLHKSQEIVSIRRHVTQTFKAVLRRGQLMPVLIVLIADSVLSYLAFEFSQLWIIALGAPLLLFGPLNALQLSTVGLGSMSASRFGLQRYRRMLLVLAALTLGSLGLIFFRTLPLIIVSLDILCVCVIALRIIFGRLLHDSLSSTVRAGAASAVSTVGRVIIIPVSLLFGYMSERADVFAASWILFLLVGVIIVFTIKTYSKSEPLRPPGRSIILSQA
jgi:MFS family permease